LFAQLRRYNLAVLSAAEAAADFAAILYTDAPPNGESDEVEPMDAIPLERNMMLTVPAGWKLSQLDPKQPAANHAEFVKVILSEIARCVCSTFGSVAGDFSGFNYASGRLDNQIYHKSILVDRSFWELEILNRIFAVWVREYALSKALFTDSSSYPRHTWFWDGFPHVDPGKEANAQEKRLNNHTTTLAAECAKDGRDYMSVLRQRAKELNLMRKLNIPITTNQSSDSDEVDDSEELDTTHKGEEAHE
jgi:capsid protein